MRVSLYAMYANAPPCLCAYIYIYMYIYMYIYIYTYSDWFIHALSTRQLYVYRNIHTYAHTYIIYGIIVYVSFYY